MQTNSTEPMNTSLQFCPNEACSARGQTGQGTIRIHDRKRQRYRCTVCQKTFSGRRGTMFEGLRKPANLIVIIVTLLSCACPVQAIVYAFGLDERTVADWRDRAGAHGQRVHEGLVEQANLDLMHVQADAHLRERMQHDWVDGIGQDGFDAAVEDLSSSGAA